MQTSRQRSSGRSSFFAAWLAAVVILVPSTARAQYGAPELETSVPGENYHIEFAPTFWSPDLSGIIASEKFGFVGSQINFIDDLGFEKTRFTGFRLVLRPSRKSKFRVQYTPVRYEAETTLRRDITFNGQKFPVSLPLQSLFEWNVWRFGYEYDVFYRPRGYVGLLLEGRYTRMTAQLASPLATEFTKVRAPLPAIGVVGRAYPIPEVALNFEMSFFRLPEGTIPDIEANYYDWDINGTVNVHRTVGLQIGWRRMTNFLDVEEDTGDVKFQGIWFGAAFRY